MTPAPAKTPSRRNAEFALLLATVFWGWTFPVIKETVAQMPVFAFLAARFGLATLCMLPFSGLPPRRELRTGCFLGVLLFAVFALQTGGLVFTSSANSAFITGMYLVWVMLAAGRGRRAVFAVALALAGLWLLAAPDESGMNAGDLLTLACSVFIAWHLLAIAKLPENANSAQLAAVQFAVVAALSFFASLFFEEGGGWKWNGDLLFAVLLTSLGATVFSFWAQTHFQRRTSAVRAGLIFVMESFFALLFSAAFYGEALTPRALAGGALMFAAMTATILAPRKSENKVSPHSR